VSRYLSCSLFWTVHCCQHSVPPCMWCISQTGCCTLSHPALHVHMVLPQGQSHCTRLVHTRCAHSEVTQCLRCPQLCTSASWATYALLSPQQIRANHWSLAVSLLLFPLAGTAFMPHEHLQQHHKHGCTYPRDAPPCGPTHAQTCNS
jgi:hypothetical protein